MLGGDVIGILGAWAFPFLVLETVILIGWGIRGVPRERWKQPSHWVKAIVLGAFLWTTVLVPCSCVLGLVAHPLLRALGLQ